MMLVLMVVYVVLLVVWPLYGCWVVWDPAKPYVVGSVLIPWFLFLILGLVVFGAVGGPPGPSPWR